MTSPTTGDSSPAVSQNPRLNDDVEFVIIGDDEEPLPTNDGTGFTEAQAYAYLAGDMALARVTDQVPADINVNPVIAAAGMPNIGAMIALIPSDDDLDRLALDGGEDPNEMHVTLFYLGDAVNISAFQRAGILAGVQEVVLSWASIAVTGFGAAIWNPDGDSPSLVLNIGGCDCLEDAHDIINDVLETMMFELCEQHEPWVPHICLAYDQPSALIGSMSEALARTGPIILDRVRVAFADQVTDFPLVYSDTNGAMTS